MDDVPERDDLARLEAAVLRDPTSEEAHERLLGALSAAPDHFNDPRRFELIEWFIDNSPCNSVCTTPFMRVDAEAAPEAFRRIKTRWLALLADRPADSDIVRGAAAFIAAESLDESKRLLKAALAQKPNDGRLMIDASPVKTTRA